MLEKDLILELFLKYIKKTKKSEFYSKDNFTPFNLIRYYFKEMEELPFEKIANNYRRKYLINENFIENVHTKEERAGLREVYDYVLSNGWKRFRNIYVILKLHSLLYSKVAEECRSFGGSFRQANAMIADSDVETTRYEMIGKEIQALYGVYDNLLKVGEAISINKDEEQLMKYLEECIRLKCRLVEIHPFADGNGRTCRAFLNILFRNVGLPPVYIEKGEKDE